MSSVNFNTRSRIGVTLLSVTCALFGSAHAAESEQLVQLQSQLDQSMKLIEQLTARVRELEKKVDSSQTNSSAPAAPVPPAVRDSNERLTSVEHEIADIAAGNADRRGHEGLPLHGFADVGAGTHNPINPDLKGAQVGSVDFYLTPQLGERARALIELNFKVGITGQVATDLERVQLGYQLADSTMIWLGRFHTPYGYYNTAFHHGQQIATSLRRPGVVQFERTGGFMPAHTVGLWLAGAKRMGTDKLTYDLYIGNGQRIVNGVIDTNNAGGVHGDAMIGGNIGWRAGGALDGFRVGASAFTVKVRDDFPGGNLTRVDNYGLYAVYDTDRWENIAEFYVFGNRDLSGTSGHHRSDDGFVQLAYRINQFTPYARYERASLDQTDNYFAAQQNGGSYHREALGVRYDLDLASALKLEFAQTQLTDRTLEQYNEALMQYAIRF